MTTCKDRFISSFESIFLALMVVWTVAIGTALVQPHAGRERAGAVEIYSLDRAS